MTAPEAQPERGNRGLITGGSAGFGLALARIAAAQGMGVVLVARDAERLATAADAIRSSTDGASVETVAADLSVSGEGGRVIAEAAAAGPLDFVCHAAGFSTRGRIVETAREDFERMIAINFLAAAELAAASAVQLAERRGRLVLIGSLASRVAPANLGAYPASKHPVAALAQQLRLEMGPAGLRALLVCPGPISRGDSGSRYDSQAEGLPAAARQPGGGARVEALDPHDLACRVLAASRAGKAELVTPRKARLLFALSQLSPTLGDWLLRRSMRG
ncbi:MAG: SDR family NAD(P)-dependent oxidoreductase [Planctomycetota bacterium]